MIILIILVIVFGVGILLVRFDVFDILGEVLSILGGMSLVVALIFVYLSPFMIHANIVRFEATRQTIKMARETGNDLEKAAIQHKIIEYNSWLASKVYWNETIFDIFIPDEVMQLKPLK